MLILLTVLALQVKASIVDCAAGKSLYKVNRLGFYPDPPQPNVNVTLELDFTVPDKPVIQSGTAVYSMTYNFLPITPTTDDLCKDTECPIEPGHHFQSTSMLLPQSLKGSLVIKTNWYDDAKNTLLCYSISAKV